jgi:uncharacterized protein YndB with AHSA1/START domain
MSSMLIAQSSIVIDASPEEVWEALTTPELIKQYFFGVDTITDWQVGSPIIHRGEWEGKLFEDKGTILQYNPPKLLQYTHWSPLSGAPDLPENYQTVSISLEERDSGTEVTIANDNAGSEESRRHSAENWHRVLKGLKDLLENR